MLGAGRAARPALGAQHHGNGDLAACHISDLRHLVGDLVHGERDEVHVHQLHHGPQAGHRGAQPKADRGRLADGCIHEALRAELLVQTLRDGVCPAVASHFFPDHEDPGVSCHLLVQRVAERVAVHHLCHRSLSQSA